MENSILNYSVITPLQPKKIAEYSQNIRPHQLRILHFDPTPIYEKIAEKAQKFNHHKHKYFDHNKRINSVYIDDMFPELADKKCSCGCGAELTGRRKKYATDDCTMFARGVWGIINNWTGYVRQYLSIYFKDWACCKCGVMDITIEYKNGLAIDGISADHIIPVKHGGGGCWLSNYQLLCPDCHKSKTKSDFAKKPDEKQLLIALPGLNELQNIF